MAKALRLRPEQIREAAGYVRVSQKVQAQGYSPTEQRERINTFAKQQGYSLMPDMVFEDHESGTKITRKGYQALIEKVRDGCVHVVLVSMFDRFGRDGVEWLARIREFESLGVDVISVQEGKNDGGLLSFVRAGLVEEYSRNLAKKVKRPLADAVQRGIHPARTPFGYDRIYPTQTGAERHRHGKLVPSADTAWVVREMYTRYAAGGASLRALALWLNSVHASPKGGQWTAQGVGALLRRPTYKGALRYNHRPSGRWEPAQPGDEFTVDGTHEGIVTPELWAEVQRRLNSAQLHWTSNTHATPSGRPVALGSGLFRCACGERGRLYINYGAAYAPRYICQARHEGGNCAERSLIAGPAHDGLLSEVRRLRGHPWTAQKERRLTGADGSEAAKRDALTRAREKKAEERMRSVRNFGRIEEPTNEEVADFRAHRDELAAQMRAIDEQLAELSNRSAALPDLRTLHDELTRSEVRDLVNEAVAQNNTAALRELIVLLVAEARVVERRPEHNPRWVRVDVTWAEGVQTLIDAGLLSLDEPEPAPYLPTERERARERQRQWRARKRASTSQEA